MCALFGVYNVPNAAKVTRKGLHGNQHRAQDYAGMVTTDGHHMYRCTGAGLARHVFGKEEIAQLPGTSALGHLRYPMSSDDPRCDNSQPIEGNWKGVPFVVAHNGEFTNKRSLAKKIPLRKTSVDTELAVRLIENSESVGNNLEGPLMEVLTQLKGSFSLGVLLPDRLIVARDPRGVHPLSYGRLEGGFAISSETTALDTLGASNVTEVEPGTMVVMDKQRAKVARFAPKMDARHCLFGTLYSTLPTSTVYDIPIGLFRQQVGRTLEKYCPTETADFVIGVPDSAHLIGVGYAESGRSGLFRYDAMLRSHFAGRNFLVDTNTNREDDIDLKFYYNANAIKGCDVVLVEDSEVRGTTLRQVVRVLRRLGVKSVHVRIVLLIMHSCPLGGMRIRSRKELAAVRKLMSELAEDIGADSLEILPLGQLIAIADKFVPEHKKGQWCTYCIDGTRWH